MDITVVSLNPSIDWQWTTPSFVYGGLNRAKSGQHYASGKGINVCAALRNLGMAPLCMGFNFRENGSIITDALDEWGVQHDFVTVEGAVRVNIKLHDATTNTMTELNQAGAFVHSNALALFWEKIGVATTGSGPILVLSGSMPTGVPADTYRQLCIAWPGMVILDADGEALKLALTADSPPFCIKPNLFELESCFGVTLSTKEAVAAFCRGLIADYGVKMICVSMGADGAMLVTETAAYYTPALSLNVRGVQGAGDAMVAGLVYGLTHKYSPSELLRIAAAAAAASVVRDGTLMCTKEGFHKYLARIPVPLVV